MGGAREGGRRGGGIADHGIDADVRACFFPDSRRVRPRCFGGIGHCRQRREIHVDPFGAVLGGGDALRHHRRHHFADKARLVVGKHAVRRKEFVRGVALAQRDVERPDDRPMRNRLERVLERVGAGEHGNHSGQRHGARRVDGANAGVGMRGTHHYGIGLAFQIDVVAEAALPGDEPRVLLAAHGSADSGSGCVLRHCFSALLR